MAQTATATPGHESGDTFEEGGRWCTPCECGRRFTSGTQAQAAARWRSHSRQASPVPDTTPSPARAKECGCGCGERLNSKANGLFRSGHDARFKATLTRAHAANETARHPWTGEQADPLSVAHWLDERRGGGDFWSTRVQAGHKPQAPRRERAAPQARTDAAAAASIARVDRIMEGLATRRPAPGDLGTVALRSGSYGARVLARETDTHLSVRLLDGPARNEAVVVADDKFRKGASPR